MPEWAISLYIIYILIMLIAPSGIQQSIYLITVVKLFWVYNRHMQIQNSLFVMFQKEEYVSLQCRYGYCLFT